MTLKIISAGIREARFDRDWSMLRKRDFTRPAVRWPVNTVDFECLTRPVSRPAPVREASGDGKARGRRIQPQRRDERRECSRSRTSAFIASLRFSWFYS